MEPEQEEREKTNERFVEDGKIDSYRSDMMLIVFWVVCVSCECECGAVCMFVGLINRPFMGFVIGNAYPMKILDNIDTNRATDN